MYPLPGPALVFRTLALNCCSASRRAALFYSLVPSRQRTFGLFTSPSGEPPCVSSWRRWAPLRLCQSCCVTSAILSNRGCKGKHLFVRSNFFSKFFELFFQPPSRSRTLRFGVAKVAIFSFRASVCQKKFFSLSTRSPRYACVSRGKELCFPCESGCKSSTFLLRATPCVNFFP